MNRLTSIVTPSASWTIGYDANGNCSGVTLNGTARSYTTEATSNRLSSISNPTRSFSYDAAGNTLTDTGLGHTTTYRLDNRINSLTKAGVSWYYSYDAGGQRIRKNNGSQNTHFVYDQSGQLLGQYAGTAPSQEFVWLGDIPVAVLNGAAAQPEVLYVYSDHLNAPRVVVDKNNATRWRWISEPFGTTAPEEAPAGLTPVTLNLRFPGQYFDKESGLSYNYFRDYDGTSGRYVQSDPTGLKGGINTYVYVEGDPLIGVDPEGLQRVLPGPVPVPVPGPSPSVPAPKPIDPTEPNGPGYTPAPDFTKPSPLLPTWNWDGITWPSWMESRRSDKERATDVPSWSKQYPRRPEENCAKYAERILTEHYGCDDPRAKDRGPGSEYSKIKKHCERGGK
ncbi:RHS repeat domain-containing protein [Roseateles sp. MS654]|uniref:RHS repeat domain-containing protein n=1 Tax=Roseateles sp. MS654 TaxID=3412685 RepID=UPI003C2FCA77